MEQKQKIGQEIKSLSNLIKRRIDKSVAVFNSDGITGTQVWIIGYIYRNNEIKPIFQKDIEAEFNIRRSTATGILQLMEKNGLIVRESVDYDARLKKLVLTPKAIEKHEAFINEIMKMEAQLEKGLTDVERQTFLTVLKKIKDNISE